MATMASSPHQARAATYMMCALVNGCEPTDDDDDDVFFTQRTSIISTHMVNIITPR